MNLPRRTLHVIGLLVLGTSVLFASGCQRVQRSVLFHPTHHARDGGLERWTHEGALIGFARQVPAPQTVWLMLHGNGGQAADRAYALPAFAPDDSVFILEYPGYGQRPGQPSRSSFDAAARQAYELLRARFPDRPVGVVGESVGSGPAGTLGALGQPPDKLVFIVPFGTLRSVGRDYASAAAVSLVLAGTWDNVEALAGYRGPMDVFGAANDEIINVRHARALAQSRPQARFQLISGGHNEWPAQREVRIRNP